MAAPPGMNPWTSCHLLHEPDGLLHLPTREMAVAYHRCVFMSWPRMETHGDPDGWSARQMTDLCFSQWEDMMIRQEDVGSAQCSTTLNQHVLFTQTKNLLCQGRPGSTCYFCMMIHVYYCIHIYIYIFIYTYLYLYIYIFIFIFIFIYRESIHRSTCTHV